VFFRDIIGHTEIKKQLIQTISDGHVGHALMFLGPEGSGTLPLALAFSGYIFCENPTLDDRCGKCKSCIQTNAWSHPDLHMSFPIEIQKKIETTATYAKDFLAALKEDPYMSLKKWELTIGDGKKKSIITAAESQEIIRLLSLKSFHGGHKIMIIWHADKMNNAAANKLLKTLEEPTKKTIVILVTASAEDFLPTIMSRTQKVNCGKLSDSDIARALEDRHEIDPTSAKKYAHISDGNFYLAKMLAMHKEQPTDYLDIFTQWMRACVTSKMPDALTICEKIAAYTKDQQQYFLEYCLQFLHQSIVYVHLGENAARFDSEALQFARKFAPYMEKSDLEGFQRIFSTGHYMVERNINPQLLFLKMSQDMMKLFKLNS